jgi:hypothetical protein
MDILDIKNNKNCLLKQVYLLFKKYKKLFQKLCKR